MSAPTTGQLADIPDHLPAIAPPIGPAVDVLAECRAFLAERARLARNPDVKLAYERAENRFKALDAAVAELIEDMKGISESLCELEVQARNARNASSLGVIGDLSTLQRMFGHLATTLEVQQQNIFEAITRVGAA